MKHIKENFNKDVKKKINYCLGCVTFIHVACSWMCVLFYFSFVCLDVCAQVCVLHACLLFLDVCFVLLLFYLDYMYMRLLLSPWSIAGIPSSQALPGFLTITTHHL